MTRFAATTAIAASVFFLMFFVAVIAAGVAVWVDGIVTASHTGPTLWIVANAIPLIGFCHGILHLAGIMA